MAHLQNGPLRERQFVRVGRRKLVLSPGFHPGVQGRGQIPEVRAYVLHLQRRWPLLTGTGVPTPATWLVSWLAGRAGWNAGLCARRVNLRELGGQRRTDAVGEWAGGNDGQPCPAVSLRGRANQVNLRFARV